jgi:protein-disulfide isomerase
VGDEIIRLEDVEQSLRARLAQIERQRYELVEQRLDQLIAERLIAQEAARRGVPPETLVRDEIQARTPQVTDDEVTAFMTQNRARLPRGDEAELRLRVRDHLQGQKANQARQDYVDTLRARIPVTVYLQEPAAARVAVNESKGFARGPADAPVVIVEFSDFQCPYCKTVVATVKQVLGDFPGKVKWIFRDFPLASIHPTAPKAHEAARCAAEQNKFWEYHDLLFERSPRHQPEQLKKYAEELQLDATAFAGCLDSGRHEAAVKADIEEGAALGITGTPSFYVNGRALVGAQPYAAFKQAIERELARQTAR